MPAFTHANAADAAAKSHAERRGRSELKQALVLLDLAYKAALAIYPTLSLGEKLPRDDAMALASLLKSWDTISNRIRILRGKPLPGSRRPAPEPAKPKYPPPKNRPPVAIVPYSSPMAKAT
jgi:hypothetical protein